MTRTESRRLVRDGRGVTVELHSGSCVLDTSRRRAGHEGDNGIARYSDEAYKERAGPAAGTTAPQTPSPRARRGSPL